MFLHLYMSVHTSILQIDLSRILGTSVLFVSVLFFFFCSKGFSSSKSCTRILFRKIRTLPDFCCYLIIVVVLFRQNYYPQIVDWFPTSRECVCMEFVGWLLVVIDSCFHDKISSPHFYDQFNFENSQCFL